MTRAIGVRGRSRRPHVAERGNHDRWLITYADTITLLLVLFIVLFAIGQVDMQKFKALADGMATGFGRLAPAASAGATILPDGSSPFAMLDAAPVMSVAAIPNIAEEMAQSSGAGESAALRAARAAAARDTADLDRAERLIDTALRKAGLRSRLQFTRDARGLTLTVIVDDLVFPADSAELQPAGLRLLNAIGPALRASGHEVVVEGHTNTVPVRPRNYPSEWELSSARASSVARHFVSSLHVDPRLLSVVGYGDTRPLLPESDPRSTSINRRVAIAILSSVPAEQRALLNASATGTAQNPNSGGIRNG